MLIAVDVVETSVVLVARTLLGAQARMRLREEGMGSAAILADHVVVAMASAVMNKIVGIVVRRVAMADAPILIDESLFQVTQVARSGEVLDRFPAPRPMTPAIVEEAEKDKVREAISMVLLGATFAALRAKIVGAGPAATLMSALALVFRARKEGDLSAKLRPRQFEVANGQLMNWIDVWDASYVMT